MRTIQSLDFPGDAKAVAAGTVIFRVDDPPDCMYSLLEGEVDILIKDVVVDTIHAGGLFGEMAVIENDRRAATAVARTDVKLVALDQGQFQELIARSPAWLVDQSVLLLSSALWNRALEICTHSPRRAQTAASASNCHSRSTVLRTGWFGCTSRFSSRWD